MSAMPKEILIISGTLSVTPLYYRLGPSLSTAHFVCISFTTFPIGRQWLLLKRCSAISSLVGKL